MIVIESITQQPSKGPRTASWLLVFVASLLSVRTAAAHDVTRPARELRLHARLDGASVVRSEGARPPTHGSGSSADAEAILVIDTLSGDFSFDIWVRGIDPATLDDSHGDNATAIHVRFGDPDSRGSILIDVHHFSRELNVADNGVEKTEDGFFLHADGDFNGLQGDFEPEYTPDRIVDFLRVEEAYVSIRTSSEELYRDDEIRGQLRVVPEVLRLTAQLDGEQVLRPPQFRPPERGSGSSATATANLTYFTSSNYLRVDLDVDGIAPEELDSSFGPNGSSMMLFVGDEDEIGEPILDIDVLAHGVGDSPGAGEGVVADEDGFSLATFGAYRETQGELESRFSGFDFVEALLDGEVYASIHTSKEPLFRFGEIRGAFERRPNRVRIVALLDGEQVVRPSEFAPPSFGSGSDARGVAEIEVDLDTADFSFELDVSGIDIDDLSPIQGGNESAVAIHWGVANQNGPILVDVEYYARESAGGGPALVPAEDGFSMRAEGRLRMRQGEHFARFPWELLSKFLRTRQAYVAVYTKSDALFESAGEIRGQFRTVPDVLELNAKLDGSQVARPPEHAPPELGTGSEATADLDLSLDTRTGAVEISLEVEGISVDDLAIVDEADVSAIRISEGSLADRGTPRLDLYGFVVSSPNGQLEDTPAGFRLHVAGLVDDPAFAIGGLSREEVVRLLQSSELYVEVATTRFDYGEIRGSAREVAELIELSAFLDESQIVRPPSFRPPLKGSGSDAVGTARLTVDPAARSFDFELAVEGISPERLFNGDGSNLTAVHVERGSPIETGRILIDVHHYARLILPDTNGVELTRHGFRMFASGPLEQIQGRHDSSYAPEDILDALRDRYAYVVVHSSSELLYRSGEIRGHLPTPGSIIEGERFVRGDCNGDGTAGASVSDAVFLLNFNFGGGDVPGCLAACDVDGDGRVRGLVNDAIYLLNFGFLGGSPPPMPHPDCGASTSLPDRRLGCETPGRSCR